MMRAPLWFWTGPSSERQTSLKTLRLLSLFLVPLVLLGSFLFLKMDASSYKVYVIHTGSMSPTIPSGSAVLVHEGHYRVGQVVTFTEDGLTVTHRLVSVSAGGLTTTQGDANRTVDPWHVPKSQIIGGVVLAPRWVGYWIMYFKNPVGIVSALLAMLVVWQIWSLPREGTSDSDRRRDQSGGLLGHRRLGNRDHDNGLVSAGGPTDWSVQLFGAESKNE